MKVSIKIILFIVLALIAAGNVRAGCVASGISGNATLKMAEDWLVDYINLLRTEPEKVLEGFGLDDIQIELPVHEEMLCNRNGCFPQEMQPFPLAKSLFLDKLARKWAEDMVRRNYFSYRSPEGYTIKDVLLESGYPSSNGTQIISAILINDFQDPCRAGIALLRNLIKHGISDQGWNENVGALLDGYFNSIGVALVPAMFRMPDDSTVGAYFLTIILDRPNKGFQSRLVHCGHFYEDMNGDGLYQGVEGLEGLILYNDMDDVFIKTYKAGMFCFERPSYGWHLYMGDSLITGEEIHGVSFWSGAEFLQDISFDKLTLNGI